MSKILTGCGVVLAVFVVTTVVVIAIVLVFALKGDSIFAGESVAIVNILGEIHHSRPVIDKLHEYEKNPVVKAIVLRIDSPGGSVAPTQEIYEEVNKIRLKDEIPVIASLGAVAASGGYYIACGAEKIIANPATITGSIGVLMNIVNTQKLMEKIGVRVRTIKSVNYKDIGSPTRELTDDEKKVLEDIVGNIHNQFLNVVRQRRVLSAEDMEIVADGRIFTGQQAMKYNLVDEIGNLDDAVEIAARAGGIKGEPEIIMEKKRFSLLRLILGMAEGGITQVIGNRLQMVDSVTVR